MTAVRRMIRRAFSFAIVLSAGGSDLAAQLDTSATTLKPVVVTVTRGSGRTILGSPFAISIVQPDSSRPGQRHASIDETLGLIPGVVSVNRNNPAQDPRLSIRGFGSRSAFGVRGVRVLRDGMPVTLPDGQTPLDYVSLESVSRIEVLRGAASALYGNASGGVVDLRSAEPSAHPLAFEARQWLGSNALSRSVVSGSGTVRKASYIADVSHSRADGSRDHSTHRATLGFARIGFRSRGTDLALTTMALANPLAQNPGALTIEEMRADTEMADALSVRRNARKVVNQVQIGASALRSTSRSELSLSAYGGARSLDNPLTFAVVEIGRHTWGASGSVRTRRDLFGAAHSLAVGVDLQSQNDLRRNLAVCADTVPLTAPTATCPTIGSDRGIVTLDQRELVKSVGVYATDEVQLLPRVNVTGGIRADRIRFSVRDRLVSGSNPDDSGDRTLSAISPVAGVLARVATTHSAYANLSAAFETPTATELGNREDGSAGLNPDLDPQRSITAEAGVKGWLGNRVRYDLSAYRTRVRDELIPFEIPASNGRRYFRNAGRTARTGAEASTDISLKRVSLMLAYTYSRFRFRDYVLGTDDFAGNAIPGIPSHRLQGAVAVAREPGFVIVETEYGGKAWLDDANSVRASPYALTNVRAGFRVPGLQPRVSVTTGIQNILDRVYSSSLIVNAARGKYYEPAARRSFFIGLGVGGTI